MRSAIRFAPPAEAKKTISYRIPAFALKRVVVWYAAFSNPCRELMFSCKPDHSRITVRMHSLLHAT